MKISDDALIFRIWETQLSLLPRATLHRFVNGGYAVVEEDWYKQSTAVHIMDRHLITDKIGTQQLRKRIMQLINGGALIWAHKDCTFMLDTQQAKGAFAWTREWWLRRGIHTGYENGKCLTTKINNLSSMLAQCKAELLSEFRQINWDDISYITTSSSHNGLHRAA